MIWVTGCQMAGWLRPCPGNLNRQPMATIPITVNGQPHEVPEGLTVLGLIESLRLKPDRVAVEVNRQVVRRAPWASQTLPAGAQVEIVHFVGGG